MHLSRPDLDRMLGSLEALLPTMVRDHPDDGEFWSTFTEESQHIEDLAAPADPEHVRSRINCMLGSNGLIPSDNEGEPCNATE
jgi:hypothetical protein